MVFNVTAKTFKFSQHYVNGNLGMSAPEPVAIPRQGVVPGRTGPRGQLSLGLQEPRRSRAAPGGARGKPPTSRHSRPSMNNTSDYSRYLVVTLALGTALHFCGCASSHRFTVEADRQTERGVPERSYRLTASVADRSPVATTALSRQFVSDVRTALSGRGLFEAPEGVAPELEIRVELVQGAAVHRTLTHEVPIYVSGPSAGLESQKDGRSRTGGVALPKKVGEQTVTQVVTVYPKALRLTARSTSQLAGGGDSAPLWTVLVTNEDESNDLAHHSRLMVAAAMDLIGRDTGAPQEVVLSGRDGRVAFIEQGIVPSRTMAVGQTAKAESVGRADG